MAAERPPSAEFFRILFVAPYVPSPLRPRPFHFIKGLAGRGHRLTLVAAATSAAELADAAALVPFCERVEAVRIPVARSLWSCARGLVGSTPLQALYCHSPAVADAVRRALEPPAAFDVLHVEHLRAALHGMRTVGLPRIYDAVDCMSRLLLQTASSGPTLASRVTARAERSRTARFEQSLLSHFDRILLSADTERDAWLANLAGANRTAAADRVRVLRNGVDLEYGVADDARRDLATLVFVGRMGYHANLAAALRLLNDILPRVWARRPETRLLIVGADPPAALRTLASREPARVELTGYVADVRPYLARATVSVNPLSYAVGVQNKVLEAMALRTPVVATSVAAAGLTATPGRDLLIADDADAIAAAVLRLLDDPAEARTIGAAGRHYVEAQHRWPAVVADLETIYAGAIADFTPAARAAAAMGVA